MGRLVTVSLILAPLLTAQAQQLAFPSAEGFGRYSIGGRGGQVLEVTNLDDSGPGSLRAAVGTSGPRIVVFRVSGTIALQSPLRIQNPYITIAGQTAPGDGICLKNYDLQVRADHVIIRYMRFRLGNEKRVERDSVWVGEGHHIIIDHCSASWAVDETLSVTIAPDVLGDVTVQWCMITESLNCSTHVKGCHGYGSLNRGGWGNGYSFHHNLYAHHKGRNPFAGNYNSYVADPCGFVFDFRNNVIYNWGSYAGNNGDSNSITRMNFINNYYLMGPDTDPSDEYAFRQSHNIYNRGYFHGNWMNDSLPADPWSLVRFDGFTPAEKAAFKLSAPIDVPPIETDDANVAYEQVLADAGATFPVRDEVDERVIDGVINGIGQIINCVDANDFYFPTGYAQAATSNTITLATSASDYDNKFNGWQIEILSATGAGQAGQVRTITDYVGSTRQAILSSDWDVVPDTNSEYGLIVDCTKNAGGWPVLQSAAPPDDTDHDGMPDEWEFAHCLDPYDANDSAGDRNGDGYTNIEEYINWLPLGEPMPPRANVNCDDMVDFYDFSEFAEHYASSDGSPLYDEKYDFDNDGLIRVIDLFYIARDWLWVRQMAWLSGYDYRQKAHIDSSPDGELSDYQVKFTVHKGNGASYSDQCYLNGHALNWPNDIRITEQDGVTELNYWCEKFDDDVAVLWVKVNTIPASGGVDIYIYYGKASIQSASNGWNTFVAFENGANPDGVGIPFEELADTQGSPEGLCYQDGYLYQSDEKAAGTGSRIYQLDPDTGAATGEYFDMPSEANHSTSLLYWDGYLWVSSYKGNPGTNTTCYKIDLENSLATHTADIQDSFTFGDGDGFDDSGIAVAPVTYDGHTEFLLAEGDWTDGKILIIDVSQALTDGNIKNAILRIFTGGDSTFISGGITQGATIKDGHLYRSGDPGNNDSCIISRYTFGDFIDIPADTAIFHLEGQSCDWWNTFPKSGLQDIANDNTSFYTMSEHTTKLYRGQEGDYGPFLHPDWTYWRSLEPVTTRGYGASTYSIFFDPNERKADNNPRDLGCAATGIVDCYVHNDGEYYKSVHFSVAEAADNSDRVMMAIETEECEDGGDEYFCYWDGSWHSTGVERATGWVIWRFILNGSNCQLKISTDNGESWTDAPTINGRATKVRVLSIGSTMDDSGAWLLYKCRKYTPNEPIWNSWG